MNTPNTQTHSFELRFARFHANHLNQMVHNQIWEQEREFYPQELSVTESNREEFFADNAYEMEKIEIKLTFRFMEGVVVRLKLRGIVKEVADSWQILDATIRYYPEPGSLSKEELELNALFFFEKNWFDKHLLIEGGNPKPVKS